MGRSEKQKRKIDRVKILIPLEVIILSKTECQRILVSLSVQERSRVVGCRGNILVDRIAAGIRISIPIFGEDRLVI